MANSKSLHATIFVPTYNGQKYLSDLIDAVFSQNVDFKYEVLIIDSGSTDNTLEIVEEKQRKHHNLRLHQIPNTEFGHGKTRNLAAQMAKGEFIVYLSHDAIPAHDRWLYEMLQPFNIGPKVVAVMGRQIPRQLCPPLLKYEIVNAFGQFGPDFGTTIFYKDDFIKDQGVFDAVRFYSDVNSATKTDFIINTIPYKDVQYAEDQQFGEDLIKAGYQKAYAPRGLVVHSNDLTLKEYAPRMFDETMGMRRNGVSVDVLAGQASTRLLFRGVVGDGFRIIKDGEYSLKRKVYWLIVNPLYRLQKHRGIRRAVRASLDDSSHNRHSLEHRKRKAK